MSTAMSTITSGGVLTDEACALALAAARQQATALGVKVSIAIMDPGGHLLAFLRMDEIHAGTAEVSMAKARCAAMFMRPTKVFADSFKAGASEIVALPGVVPFEGGLPVLKDGRLLAAVGCSGATPQQDGEIASAAIAVIDRLQGEQA